MDGLLLDNDINNEQLIHNVNNPKQNKKQTNKEYFVQKAFNYG